MANERANIDTVGIVRQSAFCGNPDLAFFPLLYAKLRRNCAAIAGQGICNAGIPRLDKPGEIGNSHYAYENKIDRPPDS